MTREAFVRQNRITNSIARGEIFADLGIDRRTFDSDEDRLMLCGSMTMIKETAALLELQGLTEGANAHPGHFVIERAFVG